MIEGRRIWEKMSDMKNYKRRLMITAILLMVYGISLLVSVVMIQVVSPMLSWAEKVNLGLSEGNLRRGTMVGLIMAGIYMIAGINGISVSKGNGNTKVCWIATIVLMIILTIDVIANMYQLVLTSVAVYGGVKGPMSLTMGKRMSQFIVKMITLVIYVKAADKVY